MRSPEISWICAPALTAMAKTKMTYRMSAPEIPVYCARTILDLTPDSRFGSLASIDSTPRSLLRASLTRPAFTGTYRASDGSQPQTSQIGTVVNWRATTVTTTSGFNMKCPG